MLKLLYKTPCWTVLSHLDCFPVHSGQIGLLSLALGPSLVVLCFLILYLYKQFLLLNCKPQSWHWNWLPTLGTGSSWDNSFPLSVCGEAVVVAEDVGGSVVGDGWSWELSLLVLDVDAAPELPSAQYVAVFDCDLATVVLLHVSSSDEDGSLWVLFLWQ